MMNRPQQKKFGYRHEEKQHKTCAVEINGRTIEGDAPANLYVSDKLKIKSRKHLERLAKRQLKQARIEAVNQDVGNFGRIIIRRKNLWRFLCWFSVAINLCLAVAVAKAGLL